MKSTALVRVALTALLPSRRHGWSGGCDRRGRFPDLAYQMAARGPVLRKDDRNWLSRLLDRTLTREPQASGVCCGLRLDPLPYPFQAVFCWISTF
jgi:hypothetical protein